MYSFPAGRDRSDVRTPRTQKPSTCSVWSCTVLVMLRPLSARLEKASSRLLISHHTGTEQALATATE